jgi:hypothetical protein
MYLLLKLLGPRISKEGAQPVCPRATSIKFTFITGQMGKWPTLLYLGGLSRGLLGGVTANSNN